MRHVAQLDGVRAFAILFVIYHHYGTYEKESTNDWWGWPWGWFGVRLFFVLSGFLITRIILNCRDDMEARGQSLGSVLYNFYARRFLRIFPLYYLYIAFLFVIQPVIREHWYWFVTYLQNYWFFWVKGFPGQGAGHLWTLAIEEQFYLFWPVLVLLVPRRMVRTFVTLVVLLGPLSRLLGCLAGFSTGQVRWLTTSNLDSLGLGALLAVIFVSSYGSAPERERWLKWAPWAGLAMLAGVKMGTFFFDVRPFSLQPPTPGSVTSFVFFDLGAALVFVWFVYRAAIGFGGWFGRLLSWGPMAYTGQISYGLYVFHPVVWGLWERILRKQHLGLRTVLSLITLYVVAGLSWRLFESPINNLKKHFPYSGKAESLGPNRRP